MQFFAGKGYSDDFVLNMKTTIDYLNAHPEEPLILSSTTDIICGSCPHIDNQQCQTQEKVTRYDQRCLDICNLKNNVQTTWKAYVSAIKTNIIRKQRLSDVCWDCEWHSQCTSHSNNQSSKEE
jgi:hypothetical protein